MEERLKTYLRPGEQVRWQGRPAPFSLLEAEAKKQILLKWGLTVALGGGLLAVYLSRTEAPSMGFIGLVLLVAAVILISPVAERRNLMGAVLDHQPAGHSDDPGQDVFLHGTV